MTDFTKSQPEKLSSPWELGLKYLKRYFKKSSRRLHECQVGMTFRSVYMRVGATLCRVVPSAPGRQLVGNQEST